MSEDRPHTLIVGGGIIGIACAHYLTKAGRRVTVIDQGEIGAACSHGNCGLVCPSHVLPLAEPGAWREAVKALLSPGRAFRIRPRVDPALWQWLWRFWQRCNRDDMLQSGRAIQPLLMSSMQLYNDLVQDDAVQCEWQKRGLLFAYRNQKPFEAYSPVNELLTSEFDEPARRLSGDELQQLDPSLKPGLAGGWYFEHDAHLRPDRLIQSWKSRLEQLGVRFLPHHGLCGFDASDGTVRAAKLSDGSIDADNFVVATGAWTPQLSQILGCRIPIEPGKGYSITIPRPSLCPRFPMIFPEHRVALTPMESGLRLGSIMEFVGYDSRIPSRRLRLLTEGASAYLREPIAPSQSDQWYGWRPMTYDSTPVIDRCPTFSNVYLATGHNMLGLSMAPATGRLITELITGETPHLNTSMYVAVRFFKSAV